MTSKPFGLWVVVGSMAYMAVYFSLFLVRAALAGFVIDNPNVPFFAIFAVLSVLTGLICFREKRWGFIYAAGLSLSALLLYGTRIVSNLYTPNGPFLFLGSLSGLSVLPLNIFFSVQSFRNSHTMMQSKYLATHASAGGLLTVAVIGFLIGGSLVSLISASSINKLLGSKVEEVEAVRIVSGADRPSNPQFYVPATVTVVIGKNNTLTWFNGDHTTHTVTSDQGLFDSGIVNSGDTWRYTFTQVGTYPYLCTIHPFMKATVVVKGS